MYCRTIATAVTEYLTNLTQHSLWGARPAAPVVDFPDANTLTKGPGSLLEQQDELSIVMHNLTAGSLQLSDYLLEMFERASAYFSQIGRLQLPDYKNQQLQQLLDMARAVRRRCS